MKRDNVVIGDAIEIIPADEPVQRLSARDAVEGYSDQLARTEDGPRLTLEAWDALRAEREKNEADTQAELVALDAERERFADEIEKVRAAAATRGDPDGLSARERSICVELHCEPSVYARLRALRDGRK